MPFSASPNIWEFDPSYEALPKFCSTNSNSANQMLMESSYTNQAWSPSNQSSFQDLSAPGSRNSTLLSSSSSMCTDWDMLHEPQPKDPNQYLSAQWLSSDMYQPCVSGCCTCDDTHEDFHSTCANIRSATNRASPSTFANPSSVCSQATSANDLQSPLIAVNANQLSFPVLQEGVVFTFRPWETSPSAAVEAEPAPAGKRGRPRKGRTNSETSSTGSSSSKHCKERVPHNQVERKYREGLNASLRLLQRAVPIIPQPEDEEIRPSKSMVIARAIEYIRKVERERDEAVQMAKDLGCSME